jgi:hypothetical protein
MATISPPAPRWRNDRLFYTGMGVVLALVTFAGFAQSYFLNYWFGTPPGMRKLDPLLHVHGAVFTSWILLGIAQPALIARGNRDLHRKLGWAGVALAAVMVAVGNLAGIAAMNVGFFGLGDPHAFYAIIFWSMLTFAIIVAFAVRWRNRAETHKRLMLLSYTQIVEAAVARLPIPGMLEGAPFTFFLGADLIIVAGAAYDLVSRGRVHKVWIWGGGLVVASQLLRVAVAQTEPWLDFARALAGLWPA